jgi:hypothetical protein
MPAGWEGAPTSSKIQREDFAKAVGSSAKMKGLTKQMRALLAEAGASRVLPGQTRNRIKQLATQIQIEAKNVAELGALSGPDMALMEAIAADPSQVSSFMKDTTGLLDGLDSWGDNAVSAKAETIGATRKGAGGAGAAGGAPSPAKQPDAKAALEWAKANPSDPRAAAILKRLGAP